jgi:hypothetical protein
MCRDSFVPILVDVRGCWRALSGILRLRRNARRGPIHRWFNLDPRDPSHVMRPALRRAIGDRDVFGFARSAPRAQAKGMGQSNDPKAKPDQRRRNDGAPNEGVELHEPGKPTRGSPPQADPETEKIARQQGTSQRGFSEDAGVEPVKPKPGRAERGKT